MKNRKIMCFSRCFKHKTMVCRYCWSFICMLTLFKAIESVKMGLKRVKKKIGGEKIGPRLGKKIDRLEVYTSPPCYINQGAECNF